MTKITGTSLLRLKSCRADLQELVHEASNIMDISVLCGHRTADQQDEMFNKGLSKLHYPWSKHNRTPSDAVDIIPYFSKGKYRYDWKDTLAFGRMAGIMFALAHQKGIKLRWGGDWDMDGRSADETFLDLPHFEVIE